MSEITCCVSDRQSRTLQESCYRTVKSDEQEQILNLLNFVCSLILFVIKITESISTYCVSESARRFFCRLGLGQDFFSFLIFPFSATGQVRMGCRDEVAAKASLGC